MSWARQFEDIVISSTEQWRNTSLSIKSLSRWNHWKDGLHLTNPAVYTTWQNIVHHTTFSQQSLHKTFTQFTLLRSINAIKDKQRGQKFCSWKPALHTRSRLLGVTLGRAQHKSESRKANAFTSCKTFMRYSTLNFNPSATAEQNIIVLF